MAREMEQQQLGALMNSVPAESPAFWILLKGVYEHSDLSNREEMLEVIDFMMKQSLQKQAQPAEPDPLVAIKMREMEIDAQLKAAQLQQKSQIEDKEILIKDLVKSVSGMNLNIEKAWVGESKRRYQEIVNGEVGTVPAEEVFEKIRKARAEGRTVSSFL
jgi:hypothetical protein